MCRNIKTLFNFDPPATDDEIRAASLQFVRKLSGFQAPSRANEAAFSSAVDEITACAHRLLESLSTSAAPRDRDAFASKARERARVRYSRE
ncbi:DUF2277 domain-containing protein [Vulgatibacter incomptus]|uniref:DUF2277 domain-containing protein n=1 Tax=Vulgatibacter incomptus TaxID=1391653 RepID=A0A0K1PGY7_9BACT|nr:DUF2277 domain-containing protein [Vulgatibacter incomptus]AKU92686.1 hypothetical protein AKJ08_3073 [Vulgatibacter incomptus]